MKAFFGIIRAGGALSAAFSQSLPANGTSDVCASATRDPAACSEATDQLFIFKEQLVAFWDETRSQENCMSLKLTNLLSDQYKMCYIIDGD
ncbi:MAG: hypothetical protein JW704_12770 [Anaerolineaceae bacterium]|nr:hypothetical protein [Anaerolineaceae bacterium]